MSKSLDKTEVQYAIEEAKSGDYKSLITRFGFKRNQLHLIRKMVNAHIVMTRETSYAEAISHLYPSN